MADQIVQLPADGSARVQDSEKLVGHPPSDFDSAGAASGVQTNLTTHSNLSHKSSTGVHGLVVDAGSVGAQTVGNQGSFDFAVTFNYTQPDTNYRLLPVWTVASPFGVGYGGTTQVSGKTTTGCSVRVTQNSGANQSIGLDWWLMR